MLNLLRKVLKPELVGGRMIRSLGGWSEVKKNPLKIAERIKSDARILGDSDFISQVLSEANEKLDRRYRLRSQGYDIASVGKKVVEIFEIKERELYSGSRKQKISEARSVFCYWCVRELGESEQYVFECGSSLVSYGCPLSHVLSHCGGKWNPDRKVWQLSYKKVKELDLLERIVDDES